jgi:hypothetical protein
MNFLKQATAVEVKIGPFVDAADGVTAETGLTISQADVRLAKNGADWAQKAETTAAAHEENGWYRCLLDATDTDTCGILVLAVAESGALPVWDHFQVVEEAVYDALFAASATGALPVSAGGITTASFAAGAIDAAAIAANAIGASELAADAVTEIQSGLATAAALATVDDFLDTEIADIQARLPAALVSGRIDASVGAVAANAITAAAIATGAIDADALAADAVTEIWAKAMSDLTAVPGVTASVLDAINWMFALSRNLITQTATTQIVKKDDGTTTLGTSTQSDDGTTHSRGEWS